MDTEKADEAALAILYLTLHDHGRARKGSDRGAMARLHRTRFIEDPVAGRAFVDEVAQ